MSLYSKQRMILTFMFGQLLVISLGFPATATNLTAKEISDPVSIINLVRQKISRIRDFSADLSISINVDFLKAPESKAKLYFRQPDKTAVKSTGGFAMLPKQGLGIPSALFRNDYTAVFIRRETLAGKRVAVVKTIPENDAGDVLLTTLWINEQDSVISRIVYATKQGNISVDFDYGNNNNTTGLPAKALINFELPAFSLPKSLTGDLTSGNKPKRDANAPIKGNAVVTYSAYIINKGVPDEVFSDKK